MTTNERRFVCDVNVMISAVLLPGNKPDRALRKAQNLGELLVSETIWLKQCLSAFATTTLHSNK